MIPTAWPLLRRVVRLVFCEAYDLHFAIAPNDHNARALKGDRSRTPRDDLRADSARQIRDGSRFARSGKQPDDRRGQCLTTLYDSTTL